MHRYSLLQKAFIAVQDINMGCDSYIHIINFGQRFYYKISKQCANVAA
jgi:hypothetical protein